jgi:hypothetical protein
MPSATYFAVRFSLGDPVADTNHLDGQVFTEVKRVVANLDDMFLDTQASFDIDDPFLSIAMIPDSANPYTMVEG